METVLNTTLVTELIDEMNAAPLPLTSATVLPFRKKAQDAAPAARVRKPQQKRPRVSNDLEIKMLGTEPNGYRSFTTLVPNLYVWTTPKGGKIFRFDYKLKDGTNKTHTIGKFGKYTLAMAVDVYERMAQVLADGGDPLAEKKKARVNGAVTVRNVFDHWFPKYKDTVCEDYAARTKALVDSEEFAPIARRRMAGLEQHEILQFGQEMETLRSNGFARECVLVLEKLFTHASLHNLHKGQNMAKDVTENLKPRDSQPMEALQLEQLNLYFSDLAILEQANQSAEWRVQRPRSRVKPTTILALKILPFMTVRPSALRYAEWSWIHWEGNKADKVTTPVMYVPAFTPGTKQRTTEKRDDQKGKNYQPYRVPLSTQVVSLLKELHKHTGHSKFLFPGYKSRKNPGVEKCVSEGIWLNALRNLGWDGSSHERAEITVHGFRSLFSTAVTTRYAIVPMEVHAGEFQMDHKLTEGVRKHYTHDGKGSHRGLLVPQRAQLMQWWANEISQILARAPGQEIHQSRTERAAAFAARHVDGLSGIANA